MPPVFRSDPYSGYNFEVVLTEVSDDGTAVRGSFAEASGLEVTIDLSSIAMALTTLPCAKFPASRNLPTSP